MSDPERRRKRLYTALVVFFSVAFFACSGSPDRRGATGTEAPAQTPSPAVASLASPPPAPEPARPVEPEPTAAAEAESPESAVPPDAAPVENVPATGPEAASGSHAQAASQSGAGRVITNADLARYRDRKADFGMRDNEVVVDMSQGKSKGAPSPSKDEPTSPPPEEIEREVAEARRKLEGLTAETEALRKRIPSLHNPLLPRVAPTQADNLEEAGMDNAERLARVNRLIAENEARMETLSRRLAELHEMARAAQASRSDDPSAPPRTP